MFEKIKERIEENKHVKGLSKAMSVVDEHIYPGLNLRALDRGYGQAYAEIRMIYIDGEVTENEMKAALVTLDNQHEKLRGRVLMEQMFQIYA